MKKNNQRTFELNKHVIVESVSFKNRYGISIAAELYISKDIDLSKQHHALIIGTPYGGVKEQGAGKYAQELAQRGFVTLAFDESYNGDSSGEPRHISSPDIFVEDFSAAVDYIGTRPFVDRTKIGVVGICGSGGFSVTAAQMDKRIKAVATVSMYDMSRVMRYGWMDSMTDEERSKMLDELGEQRWKDFISGTPDLTPSYPSEPVDSISEGLNPISSEFFGYYATKRGFHPNSIGAFTITSAMSFVNFPLMTWRRTLLNLFMS